MWLAFKKWIVPILALSMLTGIVLGEYHTAVEAQLASGTVNARQTGAWNVGLSTGSNTIGKADQGTSGASAWLVTGTGGVFPATQSGTWTVQPGNTANTTAWLTTGTGGTFPSTQSGTWTVQPGNTANTTPWLVTQGGVSTFLAGQQAVTATAAALATNTTKGLCVKALVANAINVYVGPTGVAITTGDELAPGDGRCYPMDNTNRVFVIASTTGASVSWSAWQ